MASSGVAKRCRFPGCAASSSMQCPTCKKLGLPPSYFCSQDHFKQLWSLHKVVHSADANGEMNMRPDWSVSYTGTLRPGRVTPKRPVPEHIVRPDYALHPEGKSMLEENWDDNQVEVHSPEAIEKMRKVCRFARECLDAAGRAVAPGVTGDELDRLVHEAAIERNCYPSPLGYYGFPKSCCVSVNEVICHGIPDTRPLKDGDIVNIDVTVYHDGYHGDLNETYLVGNVDEESKKLVRTTYEAWMKAIETVKPGAVVGSFGDIIHSHVAQHGYAPNPRYCGHGIGTLFHGPPNVPHYRRSGKKTRLQANTTFTIEPMINAGRPEDTHWPDDWTALTVDGKRSAQFEHTILVTPDGYELLTARLPTSPPLTFLD